MARMSELISIAIETSCRVGGIALGRGDALRRVVTFDASMRHATHLVSRLRQLLLDEGLAPADLRHAYVAAGPGSFTGLRVGITVARTLGQLVGNLKLAAVPTTLAVAENVRDLAWENLGVILDAREGLVYAERFTRRDGQPAPAASPIVQAPAEFLAGSPRPLTLVGEGLGYHDLRADGVELVPQELWLPTAAGVWQVGHRLAGQGRFVDFNHLLPIYTRPPAVLRARTVNSLTR